MLRYKDGACGMPGLSPTCCWAHTILLLTAAAAAVLPAAGLLVPHAYSHAAYKPVVAPFKPCRQLFLRDPPHHQVKEYTRHHMQWAIAYGQSRHSAEILDYRKQQDSGSRPGLNVTFASTLSNSTLEARMNAAEAVAEAANAKMVQLLQSMKDAGILAALADATAVPPACLTARLDAGFYPERVAVSFAMQYYKQPEFPHAMVQSIINCNKTLPIELLANVDHLQDVAVWAQYAANTSGLVIPVISNNIHEARAFNRLARMARGHIIITAQDDDLYPQDCEWLQRAVNVFKAYPKLGLLGLRRRTTTCEEEGFPFGGGVFHDARAGLDFQFEVLVDASPFARRSSVYHELGGWDETQSAKGMCGMITDWELVMRTWGAGHWVGYLNPPPQLTPAGKGNSHEGPDHGTRCWYFQQGIAVNIMADRWPHELMVAACKRALQLNCQLLQLRPDRVTDYNETTKCDNLRRANDLLPPEELHLQRQQQHHVDHPT